MTTQNIIVKGKDNPVVIEFSGVNLNDFDYIVAKFGDDERQSDTDPSSVNVVSDTKLELNFQDTTETMSNVWVITGVNGDYPNGLCLTSRCLDSLPPTSICWYNKLVDQRKGKPTMLKNLTPHFKNYQGDVLTQAVIDTDHIEIVTEEVTKRKESIKRTAYTSFIYAWYRYKTQWQGNQEEY